MTGKKQSSQGWWWDHFTEHPGYAMKEEHSMVSSKTKVICTAMYEQWITLEKEQNRQQIAAGLWDTPRDDAAIISAHKYYSGWLWSSVLNAVLQSQYHTPALSTCHLGPHTHHHCTLVICT
ncbi:hypothetical protein BKA82DRAFT_144989 [Pisolithus tinctorius]|nr:hypothetical protein BKA82DRAFT_144989 [Pisolithus tinctorius]